MTFTERKKALTLTGPIGGQEGRNISEKGILDNGVHARGREQIIIGAVAGARPRVSP